MQCKAEATVMQCNARLKNIYKAPAHNMSPKRIMQNNGVAKGVQNQGNRLSGDLAVQN